MHNLEKAYFNRRRQKAQKIIERGETNYNSDTSNFVVEAILSI